MDQKGGKILSIYLLSMLIQVREKLAENNFRITCFFDIVTCFIEVIPLYKVC